MLFNVVNEKDPRIRITILRPSGIAAMTGSAAPPNNRQFRCIAEFVCPVPLRDLSTCSKARAYSISLSATASVEVGYTRSAPRDGCLNRNPVLGDYVRSERAMTRSLLKSPKGGPL